MDENALQDILRDLMSKQKLAVLSTQRGGQPYSNLMAFAYTEDLRHLIVATGSATRKYQNIMENSRVSIMVDNRSNDEQDFHQATATTILGVAEPVDPRIKQHYQALYLKRHPYLDRFIASPTTQLFVITVHNYLIVSRFQDVVEYRINDETDLLS